jgi:hypothetical protein
VSYQDWAAIVAICATVLTGTAALLRFIVIHYLQEMKPNSGSSMRDEIKRLETRVDKIYELLVHKGE